MQNFICPEHILLPAVFIVVDIPDLSSSSEVSFIIHYNLHAVRRHNPQVHDFVFSAVFFSFELRPDIYIRISEVISVHFHGIPESCWRHKRIRSVFQQFRNIRQFWFNDPFFSFLIIFPRYFCQRFRHHFQTCEVRYFRHHILVFSFHTKPFKK